MVAQRRDGGLHLPLVRRAPAPEARDGRDPRLRRADARRAHARARGAHPGDGQGARRALRRRRGAVATTRGRCSTRTSGSPRATGSTASSSTCPATERVPTQGRSRGGCSTACASTPRTSARRPSSTASRTCSRAATAPQRQLVVYEANHDLARGHGARSSRRRPDALDARPAWPGAVRPMIGRAWPQPRPLRRLQELRLRGQPVHHRVPVLRHAAAQARAEDRARRARSPSRPAASATRARRMPRLRALGRLRPEIPGIRGRSTRARGDDRLVALALFGYRSDRAAAFADSSTSRSSATVDGEWWRVATAPFLDQQPLVRSRRGARDRRVRLAARAPPRSARASLLLFALGGVGGVAAPTRSADDPARRARRATARRSALLVRLGRARPAAPRARRGRRGRPARRRP